MRTRTYLTGGHGQPAPRRGVRRPVRAAARPGLRRDVRGDRERHARLAAAAGHRRGPATPTRSSGPSTTASCPGCRCAAPRSSTPTRCSGAPTAPTSRPGTASARPGIPCACCPPNLMRLLSSWEQYLATTDDGGVQIHQYASADIGGGHRRRHREAVGPHRLPVARSGHRPHRPDAGRGRGRCRCGCRAGATSATVTLPGDLAGPRSRPARFDRDPVVAGRRRGGPRPRHAGPASPSPTRGSTPCAAASRSSVARWSTASSRPTLPPGHRAGGPALGRAPAAGRGGPARHRRRRGGRRGPGRAPADGSAGDLTAGAIPYYAWANRGVEGMRVWIPR